MAALGHGEKEGELALRLYGEMTRHWGQATLAPLKFRSVLTLDHSPLEFSVALSPAGAKLRWVVDCAARDNDPIESREIGVDLCRRLLPFGAELSRVDAAVGALAGVPKQAPIGVGVEPFGGKGPMFKLYFPGGAGVEEDGCLAALEALGLSGAARFVRSMYEVEGARHFLFALDMVPSAEARAKVYVRCAPKNYLAMARRLAQASGEGDDKVAMIEAFGRAMAGLPPEGGDFTRAAVRLVTTMQFVEGRDTPRSFACNYSVSPVIGADDDDVPLDDGLVSQRIGDVLAQHALDAGPYLRAVEAFRRVPLDEEYMMHDYVTLQGRPGASGVSVYLNPRFHAYHLEPDEW